MKATDENDLWVTFRLGDGIYCLPGADMDAIIIPGEIMALPGTPAWFAGIREYCGHTISIINMRTLFHMPDLEQCVENFAQMKEMHVSWVKALDESVRAGLPFDKPTDPHKCAFGVWYDHFRTNDFGLKLILRKLVTPHDRIHQCGGEVMAMMARGEKERAAALLEEARTICRLEIVPLLDQLITAYREANRGILIIVRQAERYAGLLVDAVTGLLQHDRGNIRELPATPDSFLSGVLLESGDPILAVDIKRLPF